jgi:hypothetical protein
LGTSAYRSRRWAAANKGTREFLWGGRRKTLVQIVFGLCVGGIALWAFGHVVGGQEAVSEAALRAVSAMVVLTLAWPLVIGYQYLFVAPRKLDEGRQAEIDTLTGTLVNLQEQVRPRLEIDVGGNVPPYLQIDPVPVHMSQIHLRRLRVRNAGLTPIPNVQVKVKSVRDRHGNLVWLSGIPAVLHRMNNNIVPYADRFSLSGEGEEYLDVVTLHLYSGALYVQHAVHGIDLQLELSGCPYIFAVQATGDGVPQQTENLEVGLEDSTHGTPGTPQRLYMRPTNEG